MDSWERFNETSLPSKRDFYSELILEAISDKGDYHDLCVQTDTLLLADVFENFKDICLKICDPSYFYSAPGLAWAACLKKTELELEILTDIDMLLMVQKGIRGGMCQSTYRYAKTNNKYMKNYDKNQESSYFRIFRCK